MWPTRPDGTTDVAAQFIAATPEAQLRLDEAVSTYVRRKAAQDSVDLLDDLEALPTVEAAPDDRLRVRFRGRPNTKLWRDWLVEFTSEANKTVEEAHFEGFFDYVTGSLRGAKPN